MVRSLDGRFHAWFFNLDSRSRIELSACDYFAKNPSFFWAVLGNFFDDFLSLFSAFCFFVSFIPGLFKRILATL
jgi:hypothetical protein